MLKNGICKRVLSTCIRPVKILPPVHIHYNCDEPEKNLLAHIPKQSKASGSECSIVRYFNHNHDSEAHLSESLNNVLENACKASEGMLYGVASLFTDNIDKAESEVAKYCNSPFLKAFGVNCSALANKTENYKRIYYLFQLCAAANRPVFLHSPENSRLKSLCLVAQAICQVLNDGILDFYPDLKIIINGEVIPIVLNELAGNNPSNSLQKQTTDHYLRNNILCLSDCTDPEFLSYLLKILGDNRILFSCSDNENPAELLLKLIPALSQLNVQKILNLNSMSQFQIKNVNALWDVDMEKVTVLKNLNCVHLLSSKLRDKQTNSKDFMIHADRLMTLLAEEALSKLPSIEQKDIITPTGVFQGLEVQEDNGLCVVSIVRSGDILLEAVRKLRPGIKVGKILIQRDEESHDKRAVLYYKKLPKDISDCFVLLVDPMLATGGSLICAVEVLIDNGVKPKNILFVNLYSVEEGIHNVQKRFPDLNILTLSIDDYMNDDKYIVPGVGDFGDRYYGTTD